MQEKIEAARKQIEQNRDGKGCADAIAFLNEHADEHWAFIGGKWHRSVLCKQPVVLCPDTGEMAGLGF